MLLPFPARDLAGFEKYKSPAHLELGKRTANMITSRGCPARYLLRVMAHARE